MLKDLIEVGNSSHGPPGGGHAFSVNIGGLPIPLRRTFAALDRLIAVPVEALGDALESKLKRNLDSHVEAVANSRSKKGKKAKVAPSPQTVRAIAEWATNASEIDPEDKEDAAIWRSILDQIIEDEPTQKDLERIVRQTEKSDLQYFFRRFLAMRQGLTTMLYLG